MPVAPAVSRGKNKNHTSVVTTGPDGFNRHSLRNGFNGLLRDLPGDRAFLSPSPPRSLLLKNLMPASRHQNHRTSPSALVSFASRHHRVHRIPRPTSVTMASAPLVGTGYE